MKEPNVDGLLRSITFDQFLEWKAYDTLFPFGDTRQDWNFASLAATVMNALMISVRSEQRFRPKDFLLEFKDEPSKVAVEPKKAPVPNWQRMKFIAKMWFAGSQTKKKK